MRNPPDDAAGQRRTRRRDRTAELSGVAGGQRDGASGHGDGGDRAGRTSGLRSAVFAPGYDADRPEAPDRATTGTKPGGPATSWYGSAAGGAAGKGPVRGYPPVPGQPPPMYPPGQFAAWNRGPVRRDRPGGAPPGPGQPDGRDQDDSQSTGSQSTGGQMAAPTAWQASAIADGAAPSRYYEQDRRSDSGPGYPVLAVSDPAADVTSTQTWQAVGDGRATGVWTAPARPGSAQPARPATPAISAPGPAALARSTPAPNGPVKPPALDPVMPAPDPATRALDPPTPTLDPAAASVRAARPASAAGRRPGAGPDDVTRRAARGHSGAHTGPNSAPRPRRSERPQKAQRKRPANVKLAMGTALVLVLAAVAALSYAVLRSPAKPKPAQPTASKQTGSPSVSPSPSLGPYGHIGSRTADPQPLTVTELYPVSFTVGGASVVRAAFSRSSDCAAKVVGSGIQSALGAAHCDQVVRATYLSSAEGLMGTIGVLNLSTGNAAKTAAKSADASDFISQLAAKHGPTHKIGQGTGIEEAAAKGHYLILIWAEFTSLRKPKTADQRAAVENFMTELLQNTANVSLTNRMLTGTP